jgi:pimeloyl-ACP methyl ester carboxylesterase
MNPFFFGAADRRLFGVYEPAAAGTGGKRAAILCYPWGAEYIYSHRTLRQLALKLSGIGFHTLRFDFYGTGDSGGEPTDTDLAGWEADLETAIEELTEITGLVKVTLIGLRLGGTVAAGVATRQQSKIENLVLWDPVVSGPEYLEQLSAPPNANPLEIKGFLLTPGMFRELGELDLSVLMLTHPRTLMVVTERLPSHTRLTTMWTAGRQTGLPTIEFVQDVRPWLEDSVDTGLIPSLVLQRISNWLE